MYSLLNFLSIEKQRVLCRYPFVVDYMKGKLSSKLFLQNLSPRGFLGELRKLFTQAELLELKRRAMGHQTKYLIAVDGPDPDNLVLIRMASSMFGHENILGVILTGRPVNKNATTNTPIEEWFVKQSREVQVVTAARFKNFMRAYDLNIIVYDGGIAPYTLVPHHVHFDDESGFGDVDVKGALRNSKLRDLSELRKIIGDLPFTVLVGGPMTGVRNLFTNYPELANQVLSLHAMYASLGTIKLMDLGGEKRGVKQFNVACDPEAGNHVTRLLRCPVYFVTSDCTRDNRISFATLHDLASYLKNTTGNRHLLRLYKIWFDQALAPRQERIYIHDVSAAISASEFGRQIYQFLPVTITRFPYLPQDKREWGVIDFKPEPNSNIYISTILKNPAGYMALLREHLQ